MVFIANGAEIFVEGRLAAELSFADIGRTDTPYSFLLMVPQWEIEAILVEDLKARGIEVERSTEVTGFEQSAEGVVVHARSGAGGVFDIPASYLVGADGAHSVVRKTLGLAFEGAAYPQSFLLADCRIDWPLSYGHLRFFMKGSDLAIYLPLRGKNMCRLVCAVPHERDGNAPMEQGASEVSFEEVQEAFRAASGRDDIKLSDPKWLSRYRIHHRGVNRYRVGRVFVAGDAAHIHSPAGGQGMNTGLQDAANLAWKLAMVLKGNAPPELLETYHSERWPVGEKVLHFTDRIFGAVAAQSGWATHLRNVVAPLFAGALSKSRAVRAKAFHFISQLGIRYHESRFVHEASSSAAPAKWREGLTAGHRAPNAEISRGIDVLGLIDGYRFHVLALSQKPLDESEIDSVVTALAALPQVPGIELKTHFITNSLIGRDPRILRAESSQVFELYGLNDKTTEALFLSGPMAIWRTGPTGWNVAALKAFVDERFGGRPGVA